MLRGEAVDEEQLTRLSNALARVLAALKAKAKPRDAAPSIVDYLRENYGHATSTEAGDSDLLAGDAEAAS